MNIRRRFDPTDSLLFTPSDVLDRRTNHRIRGLDFQIYREFRVHHTNFGEMSRRQAPGALINGGPGRFFGAKGYPSPGSRKRGQSTKLNAQGSEPTGERAGRILFAV